MHKAFLLPVIEFPLAEELPTASKERCHCQKKSKPTARKIALLSKVKKKLSVKDSLSYKRSPLVIVEEITSSNYLTTLASPCIHSFKITKDLIPQCLCYITRFLILSFFEITQSGESLSIHIALPISIHNKKWINNILPLPKIPVPDIGKFEQWQFRIQQYLQHEHYALWEVIEFEDSYVVPASSLSTTTTDTTSGETGTKSGRMVTLTAEDMQKKKNDVKARTTLLLSLPDENQLRFKGLETLEQTFNRLQVIIGQLQFMDIEIEHDDLNQNENEDGNTACVPTASTNVPTASASVTVKPT
nr:hypothetical protein [Tanacetum cinerariifolium]